jgi:hypothetical protein
MIMMREGTIDYPIVESQLALQSASKIDRQFAQLTVQAVYQLYTSRSI